ncbi:MAG: exodeoxyribonuclease VII small subunit [Rickettsiales bacterium]|nr:exodeoxyribonuclease VII small subunit [Rickettsiales bacterium]|tara:strand:+ start:409 stop:618 length:210 start_codon:yes stop_codon:yes gene_type:complete
MPKQKPTLEESLKDIQSVVERIENNDVDLKNSLTLYSDAIKKSKHILEELESYEEQFNILNDEKDSLKL